MCFIEMYKSQPTWTVMHQYKPGLPLFKNSTMALKVGKQFVSILVRSKKFYRGIPYKSSLHLDREIEEKI